MELIKVIKKHIRFIKQEFDNDPIFCYGCVILGIALALMGVLYVQVYYGW